MNDLVKGLRDLWTASGASQNWIQARITLLWINIWGGLSAFYIMSVLLPEFTTWRLLLIIPVLHVLFIPWRIIRWRPVENVLAAAGSESYRKALDLLKVWCGVFAAVGTYLTVAPTTGHWLLNLGSILPFIPLMYMGGEKKDDNKILRTWRVIMFGIFVILNLMMWGGLGVAKWDAWRNPPKPPAGASAPTTPTKPAMTHVLKWYVQNGDESPARVFPEFLDGTDKVHVEWTCPTADGKGETVCVVAWDTQAKTDITQTYQAWGNYNPEPISLERVGKTKVEWKSPRGRTSTLYAK